MGTLKKNTLSKKTILIISGGIEAVPGINLAKKMGLITVSFTGKDGGSMAKIADFPINVSSSVTARIQEAHITAGHAICDLIDIKLFQKPDLK